MSLIQPLKFRTFENGVFQNAPFANGCFPNGGCYSCLWALCNLHTAKLTFVGPLSTLAVKNNQ